MLLEAAMALALGWPAPRHPPAPAPAGPEFEALLRDAHGRCPAIEPKLRETSSQRLLDAANAFRDQLSGPAQSMLNDRLVQRVDASCLRHWGPACPFDAYLAALRETKLTDAFTLYLCGRGRRFLP
jgi:hypothetical protein